MTGVERFSTIYGWIILLVAGVFYHHPSERIVGQADATSYLLSGLAFARGEGFGPHRPMLDAMPPEVRECVVEVKYPLGLRDAATKLRPRPFYLEWQLGEKNPGNLVPRFPVGYPAVLSIGYRLAGWQGVLAVNGVLMLLAGLLVMYLANEWAGSIAGLFAAGLWALFPLNIWIANTTLAEPLVLVLGLTAVAAWVRSRADKTALWPILMGVSVGVAPMVKLDAIPWLVLPIMNAWDRRHSGFWRASLPVLATVPCLLGSAAVLLCAQSGYLAENLVALVRLPLAWVIACVAITGLLVAGYAMWRFQIFSAIAPTQQKSRPGRLVRLIPSLKWTAFIILAGVLVYFYFIRPHWAGADRIYWAPMGRVVPSLREVTLLRLSWYLPPVTLWVAMLSAGAAVLWARETWMRTFAAVGVAILLFISYDHINFPVEPFAGRRFLPQAVPVLIVALAGAEMWFRRKVKLLRWGVIAAGMVVLYACAHGIFVNSKMNSRSDAEGLMEKIHVLSETTGSKSIVVLRQSSPLAEIAPLLAFGFQRDVIAVRIRSKQDRLALENYLRTQEQAGRSVWLWTSTADDSLGLPIKVQETAAQRDFSVPFLHMTTTDRPFSWDQRTWKSVLKRVSFAEPNAVTETPKK